MTKSNPKQTRSVAVIGGGASGAIILDALVKEAAFDTIKVFERRDKLGGVWVLDHKPNVLNIPPGLTELELDPAVEAPLTEIVDGGELKPRSLQERYVHTASYEDLRTNIPEQIMTYSDNKSWGIAQDDKRRVEGDYVRGEVIQQYIEQYFAPNKHHIEFRTTVENVTKDYNNQGAQFELTLRRETDQVNEDNVPLDLWYTEKFDAVIVATGHYHVPFIPNVPGLSEVYHRFPHKVKHSKTFRVTDDFTDKTLIVVGTRASGADIVQIASKKARIVYQSKRSKDTALRFDPNSNQLLKPKIVRYELVDDKDVIVHFEDGSSVRNPDEIIYATGFRYSYPFLRKQYPNFTSGYIIPDLYQHTFFIKDPYLSIIGVPTDAISFRAFEYQAVLVSRFLANKIELPPVQEQLLWALTRYQNKGDSRAYHTIDTDGKLAYLEKLVEIGGGVRPLGGTGRSFPQFTEDDHKVLAEIAEKLKKFFAQFDPDVSADTKLDGISVP